MRAAQAEDAADCKLVRSAGFGHAVTAHGSTALPMASELEQAHGSSTAVQYSRTALERQEVAQGGKAVRTCAVATVARRPPRETWESFMVVSCLSY